MSKNTPGQAACEEYDRTLFGIGHDPDIWAGRSQRERAGWEAAVRAGTRATDDCHARMLDEIFEHQVTGDEPDDGETAEDFAIRYVRWLEVAASQLATERGRLATQHEAMTQLRADHSEALARADAEVREMRALVAEVIHGYDAATARDRTPEDEAQLEDWRKHAALEDS